MYIFLQLTFSILLICSELWLLYFFKDGTVRFSSDITIRAYLDQYGGPQFWLANHIRIILTYVFYVFLVNLLIFTAKEFRKPRFIKTFFDFKKKTKVVAINLISFSGLLAILIGISDPRPIIENPLSLKALIYSASPLLWMVYFWSAVSFLISIKSFWKILIYWVRENFALTLFIFLAIALTMNQEVIEGIINFWSALLLKPTLDIALSLAQGVGLNAQIFPGSARGPVFGTSQFQVEIWAACSGYEGMALIIALLIIYCYLERDLLRLSHAVLIIPLAMLAMFFLNSIRIVILIAIGHFYSPELAINGFHMVGGWLNLIVVFIACLIALNSWSYFLKPTELVNIDTRWEVPFLLPLITLIAGGLVCNIFVTNFAWLYPIPIVMSAFIIFYYKKSFIPIIEQPSLFTYFVGIFVFFLWIYLVPVDETQTQVFSQEIMSVPLGVAFVWIFFRVIGAVLIVPIAEEVAFRGFLLPFIESWFIYFFRRSNFFQNNKNIIESIATYLALAITSLLFGILHSELLAGSLAGFSFGVAYLYRRKIMDAIVSHAVTNLLLAADVIYFSNWSYW